MTQNDIPFHFSCAHLLTYQTWTLQTIPSISLMAFQYINLQTHKLASYISRVAVYLQLASLLDHPPDKTHQLYSQSVWQYPPYSQPVRKRPHYQHPLLGCLLYYKTVKKHLTHTPLTATKFYTVDTRMPIILKGNINNNSHSSLLKPKLIIHTEYQ